MIRLHFNVIMPFIRDSLLIPAFLIQLQNLLTLRLKVADLGA